jgi:hypothetical protein
MNLDQDIERIIAAIEDQEMEVLRNMVEQLRAIKDRLKSNKYYMGRSAIAALGNQYQPDKAYDPYGVPTQSRN